MAIVKTKGATARFTTFLLFQAACPKQAAEIGSDLIKAQREGRASLHDEDMAWFEEIQKENDWLKGDDYDLHSSIRAVRSTCLSPFKKVQTTGGKFWIGSNDEIREDAQQACRVGEWMDKRNPLLQCGYRLLASRGASEVNLLDRTWCG